MVPRKYLPVDDEIFLSDHFLLVGAQQQTIAHCTVGCSSNIIWILHDLTIIIIMSILIQRSHAFLLLRPSHCFRHIGSRTMSVCSRITLTDALSSKLHDPSILLDWTFSNTSNTSNFGVYDPGRPEILLAKVPSFSSSSINEMLQRSNDALLESWRDSTTAAYRANLLTEWSRLVKQNNQDLATIMTLESGKPLSESLGEIQYAASFLDFFAGEAIRSTNAGFMVPTPFVQSNDGQSPRGQILAKYQAVGLTAMITPWNFPSAMMTRKVGPALAAGCTAVVKPSELTPLSAIALATLAYRAGIPPDVLGVVTASTADAPQVGKAFCSSPLVQKISFTGSTAVGKWLLEQSASTVKRLSLELGGNAPFVVFDDADIPVAVTAAVTSKFRNAGQTCVCADRFLVHSSIHDQFLEQLIAQTRTLQVRHGLDASTGIVTMGPLISIQAVNAVAAKVDQAISMGAQCHLGGNRLPQLGTHFYEPTILSHVSLDSDVWKTENFGPVIAIHSFDTDHEALAIANDSSFGLASYFCTKDLRRAFSFSERYAKRQIQCRLITIKHHG